MIAVWEKIPEHFAQSDDSIKWRHSALLSIIFLKKVLPRDTMQLTGP